MVVSHGAGDEDASLSPKQPSQAGGKDELPKEPRRVGAGISVTAERDADTAEPIPALRALTWIKMRRQRAGLSATRPERGRPDSVRALGATPHKRQLVRASWRILRPGNGKRAGGVYPSSPARAFRAHTVPVTRASPRWLPPGDGQSHRARHTMHALPDLVLT